MQRSRKSISALIGVLFTWFLFCLPTVILAQTPSPAPDAGRVDGSKYVSTYFAFTYPIPDTWSLRSTGGKTPGVPGYLLLSLKRKSGDALSALMISAAEMPPDYRQDVSRFLLERYRMNQSVRSGVTINGIPAGSKKVRGGVQTELLTFGDRHFYRLEFDTPGVARTVLGTLERGYVVMFEVIAPTRTAEEASQQLVDSMYALTFPPAGASAQEQVTKK